MFDTNAVCEASVTNLTEDLCTFIREHFNTLAKEFNVDV